jgi:class 3 adenylate cyclase
VLLQNDHRRRILRIKARAARKYLEWQQDHPEETVAASESSSCCWLGACCRRAPPPDPTSIHALVAGLKEDEAAGGDQNALDDDDEDDANHALLLSLLGDEHAATGYNRSGGAFFESQRQQPGSPVDQCRSPAASHFGDSSFNNNGGSSAPVHVSGYRRHSGTTSIVIAPPSSAVTPAGPGPNTGAAIFAPRSVSIICVNTVGFHAAALRDGAAALSQISETLTAIVVAAVAAERGVVDSFHGDQFLLTFNAAAPCATHATRAPRCALRIAQKTSAQITTTQIGLGAFRPDFSAEATDHSVNNSSTNNGSFAASATAAAALIVTAGVATGPARCGTLGCRDSRRFSIVGAPVPQAAALERIVRRHPREHRWRVPVGASSSGPGGAAPYRIAVAQPQLDDLRAHFVCECIDVAPLPVVVSAAATNRRTNGPMTPLLASVAAPPTAAVKFYAIAQILGDIAAAGDGHGDKEWMYALDPQPSSSMPLRDAAAIETSAFSPKGGSTVGAAPPAVWTGGAVTVEGGIDGIVSAGGDALELEGGKWKLPLSLNNSAFIALAALANACASSSLAVAGGGGTVSAPAAGGANYLHPHSNRRDGSSSRAASARPTKL